MIFVVGIDQKTEMIRLCGKLRAAGIDATYDMMNRKLKKNLEYANALGIEHVVIVGAKDLENDEVTVKNMKSGNEWKIKIDEVVDYFDYKWCKVVC